MSDAPIHRSISPHITLTSLITQCYSGGIYVALAGRIDRAITLNRIFVPKVASGSDSDQNQVLVSGFVT